MPRRSRKQEILEALAKELENHPGDRITTAALARAVGVSEAALYRHFPSKARMFEGLIGFAEETVFVRINQILAEVPATELRIAKVVFLMLGFADKNPGITRVLLGDALVGPSRIDAAFGEDADDVAGREFFVDALILRGQWLAGERGWRDRDLVAG